MPHPHSSSWRAVAAVTILVPALATAIAAQQAAAPVVMVRAARMLDVVSGQMLRDATVVVTGDRITAVNPPAPPAGARTIDLGDVTLLPGFIDLHTHLAAEISATSFSEPVTETEVDAAYHAVKHARTTLMAGFTTVRDFGGQVTVSLGSAQQRGDVLSPRIVPSRNALGITGGHCDVTGFAPGILELGPKDGVADGPWEVVEAVRYQIKHGAQVIKTCATAGVLSLEGPVGAQQYSYDELKAMVDEAARHGIKVAAHAHGTEGIKAAVRAGVLSIEHGSLLDDEAIQLMKDRGTYLVPTSYLTERINMDVLPPLVKQKAQTIIPLARESLRKAIAAGREDRVRHRRRRLSPRRERQGIRGLRAHGHDAAGGAPHGDDRGRRRPGQGRSRGDRRRPPRRPGRRARRPVGGHHRDRAGAVGDAGRKDRQGRAGRRRSDGAALSRATCGLGPRV